MQAFFKPLMAGFAAFYIGFFAVLGVATGAKFCKMVFPKQVQNQVERVKG